MKIYRINISATIYKNILYGKQTATALLSHYGLTECDNIEFKCDNDTILTEITNIQHIEDMDYVVVSFKRIKVNNKPVPKIYDLDCKEVLESLDYMYKTVQEGLEGFNSDKTDTLNEIKKTLEFLM